MRWFTPVISALGRPRQRMSEYYSELGPGCGNSVRPCLKRPKNKQTKSRVWWCMPLNLALGRQRQQMFEFELSVHHTARF